MDWSSNSFFFPIFSFRSLETFWLAWLKSLSKLGKSTFPVGRNKPVTECWPLTGSDLGPFENGLSALWYTWCPDSNVIDNYPSLPAAEISRQARPVIKSRFSYLNWVWDILLPVETFNKHIFRWHLQTISSTFVAEEPAVAPKHNGFPIYPSHRVYYSSGQRLFQDAIMHHLKQMNRAHIQDDDLKIVLKDIVIRLEWRESWFVSDTNIVMIFPIRKSGEGQSHYCAADLLFEADFECRRIRSHKRLWTSRDADDHACLSA